MNILTINCGSSSVKVAVVESGSGNHLAGVRIEGIGEGQPALHREGKTITLSACDNHASAMQQVLFHLREWMPGIRAVGHRVVHGGARFVQPTRLNAEVLDAIAGLVRLAPVHNAVALAGIEAACEHLPQLPHVAVFDTAFHATLPASARAYALPQELCRRLGIRRYGFHGISHESVAQRAAEFLQSDLDSLRIISCHLGNGCSMAAIEHGRSIETSMGMTPLEGLVMGSRSGDVDPGVIIQLMRELKLSPDEMEQMLNHDSGLVGMTGVNDMRRVEERATQGDESARLAVRVFVHRIRKYIGAYAVVLGGVDVIIFTGGIGENSAWVRDQATQRLDFLGANIDAQRNRDATVDADQPVADFSMPHSRARLLVVATDEAAVIAHHTAQTVAEPRNRAGDSSWCQSDNQ